MAEWLGSSARDNAPSHSAISLHHYLTEIKHVYTTITLLLPTTRQTLFLVISTFSKKLNLQTKEPIIKRVLT